LNFSESRVEVKLKDHTIAVLPFVNMSASKANEYFSDGMTEEIINALAKIGSLKVTSRTHRLPHGLNTTRATFSLLAHSCRGPYV